MTTDNVVQLQQPEPPPEVKPIIAETCAEPVSYVFKAVFNKVDLKPLLDHWWDANASSAIPILVQQKQQSNRKSPKFKSNGKAAGKYSRQEAARILGEWGMYDPLLQQLVVDALMEKIWPKELLYSTDNGLDTTGEHLILTCRYFLTPKVHFVKGLDDLKIRQAKPTEDDIEKMVLVQKEALRNMHSREHEKLVDVGSAIIEDGDIAVVTATPTMDGVPWLPGTLKNNKMRIKKGSLHPDEMYQKMLGLEVGNHTFEFTLDEKYRSAKLEGKVVKMSITVHSILTYALPEWTDELAKELGSDNLQAFDEKIHLQVTNLLKNQWQQRAGQEAIGALIERGVFEPVPEAWLRIKSMQKLDMQLRHYKNDLKALLAAWNVPDKEEVIKRLAHLSQQEIYQYAALLQYLEDKGVERDKETEFGTISNSLHKALTLLMEDVTIAGAA
jgi:FKBP-type peptidyl-prolyl cis-trans isomerase (trigger factor)